mmetsp:Transcript_25215/g.37137  ORF Transcript_25215/g.37137 Transcript_25215/m.37137 type:complete len:161 (-) Transcript_25215:962-1444(-)
MDTLLLPKELDVYMKRESLYMQNKCQMYSVVLGQCTKAMKARLEADSQYESFGLEGDVLGLLIMIRTVAYNYEVQRYPFLVLHSALKNYHLHFQCSYVTNDSYWESYTNMREVVEHCGGKTGHHDIWWSMCSSRRTVIYNRQAKAKRKRPQRPLKRLTMP